MRACLAACGAIALQLLAQAANQIPPPRAFALSSLHCDYARIFLEVFNQITLQRSPLFDFSHRSTMQTLQCGEPLRERRNPYAEWTMPTPQTQIPKQYIPCRWHPCLGCIRTKDSGSLKLPRAMMQCPAGTTGHARVCLIAQDHLARRILSNFVQQVSSVCR